MIGAIDWNTSAMEAWRQVLEAARDAAILEPLLSSVLSDIARVAYWPELTELCQRLRIPARRRFAEVVRPRGRWSKVLFGTLGLGGAVALGAYANTGTSAQTDAGAILVTSLDASPLAPEASGPREADTAPTVLRFEGADALDEGGYHVTLAAELSPPTPRLVDGVILLPSTSLGGAVLLTRSAPKLGEPGDVSSDPERIAAVLSKLADDALLKLAEEAPSLRKDARSRRQSLCHAALQATLNSIRVGPSSDPCPHLVRAKDTLSRCRSLGTDTATEEVRLAGFADQLRSRCH
jgi:hypothetical protein